MSRRTEKTHKIIQTTIRLLSQEGAGGLTMRKIAKLADIRLSNLQYYYKDKNALLEATIQDYFRQNEAEISQQIAQLPKDIEFIALLSLLLEQSLVSGSSSERCAMFREIWALATKNPKIDELVRLHYKKHNDWLVEQFAPYSQQTDLIVSILMPYIEGYSLMGNAIPVNKKDLIAHLLKMVHPYC
ncbi:TetR/AcrR family transcriptional regulator [Aureispira anguillae]|uniref:TetR family transcriptional regulator n=1 Tax=Aureispira anguillae TaxID=2864201 RepID=A0A915VKB5_9BACT|nr:TetR family transcriptional regulator [Aureispira anguillae]BDS09621.1 TetR family transcriptional regulator [Aureispira anguillae]